MRRPSSYLTRKQQPYLPIYRVGVVLAQEGRNQVEIELLCLWCWRWWPVDGSGGCGQKKVKTLEMSVDARFRGLGGCRGRVRDAG